MKLVKITLSTLICLLCLAFTHAQRNCGSMEYLEQQMQQDPDRKVLMQQIEKQTQQFAAATQNRLATVVTIPVVVHVIYNNNTENISDAQIQTQIQVLNDDFRRLNSDADNTWSQAADTEIEFCMATVDPNGASTDGITRTSTNTTSFGTNDQMKFNASGGKDAWPADDYLNVWVCDISGGILGYAQFPGGPASTDGVVCDYQYFGTTGTATSPFDLGRTMTHEVGHYLNLRHIWGDGGCNVDDFVNDTPVSDGANYGCATGHTSCGTVDMVQNYMDYSDDACMNIYTVDQKTRMQALFGSGGSRASLLVSAACGQAPPPPAGCEDNELVLSITLDNYPEETTWTITDDSNNIVASGGPYGNQADGSTVTDELCLLDGCYSFNIFDSYGDGICCSYGNGNYLLDFGNVSLASGGSFTTSDTTPFCLGSTPPPGPTCDDGIMNGNETGIDCGGPDCNACTTVGCTEVSIDYEDFESGWGIWNDGGSDARRSANDAVYANSGNYCIRLRDNTSTSVMTTDNIDLSSYDDITVDFSYYARSMDNSNEGFWLQISSNGGSTYNTVEEWNLGDEFNNDERNFDAVNITGPFSSTTRLRFRCDASGNSDWVYLDDVEITGCINANRAIATLTDIDIMGISVQKLYPNPASTFTLLDIISVEDQNIQISISDLSGKTIQSTSFSLTAGSNTIQIDISDLASNIYFITANSSTNTVTKKIVIIND